jgi:hypothetical protein
MRSGVVIGMGAGGGGGVTTGARIGTAGRGVGRLAGTVVQCDRGAAGAFSEVFMFDIEKGSALLTVTSPGRHRVVPLARLGDARGGPTATLGPAPLAASLVVVATSAPRDPPLFPRIFEDRGCSRRFT